MPSRRTTLITGKKTTFTTCRGVHTGSIVIGTAIIILVMGAGNRIVEVMDKPVMEGHTRRKSHSQPQDEMGWKIKS